MKILTIIPTYNASKYIEYIEKNIEILKEISTVLIIDNCSQDETLEKLDKLKEKYIDIEIIKNKENYGPGFAFNQGILYGEENNYTYAYIVDQDSKVNKESIEVLLEEANILENEFSFLASAVRCEKNGEILNYFRAEINKYISFYFIPTKKYIKNKKVNINAAGYTGILFNLILTKEYNIHINTNLFIGYDDYDFTYRLNNVKPGYLITSSYITHPNKRIKYKNLFWQVVMNYVRQFIKSNNFRDQQASKNYIYMIHNYGNKISNFTKLKFLILISRILNKKVYLNTKKYINQILKE